MPPDTLDFEEPIALLLKELEATQGVARVSIFHRADEAEV